MSFIRSDGSIILDLVLTKEGRRRLAKGDGSFKISKFSLSDDEINYSLYDNQHSSGSAYYDLAILQTPVLEARTNDISPGSNLVSIARTNILYMPVLKLNEVYSNANQRHASGSFIVATNKATEDAISSDGTNLINGIMFGENIGGGASIRIDQGIDSSDVSPAFSLDSDLVETQYVVEMDNRLGIPVSKNSTKATPSYINDDDTATYFFTLGSDTEFVSEITDRTTSNTMTLAGPRGTTLNFMIQSSLELNTTIATGGIWTTLGTTSNLVGSTGDSDQVVSHIDSNITVRGATTGLSVDIPVRYVKLR